MSHSLSTIKGTRRLRRRRGRSRVRTYRPEAEGLETRLAPSIVPASSPIDVTTGIGGQLLSTHRTVAESSSNYRVVWEDKSLGIYTRLFGPDGAPQADPAHLTDTGSVDSEATVAMNPGGASVIAWTHTDPRSQTKMVLLEQFNAAGKPFGAPIAVPSAYKGGSTRQPSLGMDRAGDIVLAYTDSAPGGPGKNGYASNQVKGILYPAGGKPTPLTVTSSKATSQPSVAVSAPGGNFVIAFTQDISSSNQDISAQLFQAGGTPQGAAVAVATSSHVENEPSAAIDDKGDFVVAFTYVRDSHSFDRGKLFGWITDNYSEVHAVLFNAYGAVQKTNTVWASAQDTADGYNPSATMSSDGTCVVGYTVGGNYGAYDPIEGTPSVWANAYNPTGTQTQAGISLAANLHEIQSPVGTAGGGTPATSDDMPSVALSPSGHLVADWENFGIKYNGDTAGSGVFTQTFTNAPFQYQLPTGVSIGLWGGMPTNYPIDITRDPGFNGPIKVSFSALPAGVKVSVSGDDTTKSSEVITATFTSNVNVPAGSVASTLNISGGNVTLKPKVYVGVSPSVIKSWSTSDPDGKTLVKGFPTLIQGTGFVNVALVWFGAPWAGAVPSQIHSSGPAQWFTVTVPMNAVPGPIIILRGGGQAIFSSTNASYTDGGITWVSTDTGYAPGYDKFQLDQGTEVNIRGYGFQPGAKVVFAPVADKSNLQTLATEDGVGATPQIDPSGTALTVNVPRYALSGEVAVIEPDGTPPLIWKDSKGNPNPFTVNNYRNTFGFQFHNFLLPDLYWDLWKDEFGSNECDLQVPVFGDTGAANPYAWGYWKYAAGQANGKGLCFGISVTSLLLSDAPWQINANYGLPPGKPATVYNLGNPSGPNSALTTWIEKNHISQYSSEFQNAANNWKSDYKQGKIHSDTIKSDIVSMLQGGERPIICMQNGADHCVVPYDVEDDPKRPGVFYIDVYDSNRPFNEGGDELVVKDHVDVEQASRIEIDPDDTWHFTMADNTRYNGSFDTLEVYSAFTVANGVTLPNNWIGILINGVMPFIVFSTSPSTPASTAPIVLAGTAASLAPLSIAQAAALLALVAPAAPMPIEAAPMAALPENSALQVARGRATDATFVGRGQHRDAMSLVIADVVRQSDAALFETFPAAPGLVT